MEEAKSVFEIVEVFSECRLRNACGDERMYWRRDGSCLTPGFYVVHWPQNAPAGRFNEDALFEGPFRERSGAEASLPRLAALEASARAEDPWERGVGARVTVVDDRVPPGRRRPT